MRSQLFLVPAAIIGAATPAFAMEQQTLDAAQKRLFPGATLTPADFTLQPEQMERIKQDYKVPFLRPNFKAWRASNGEMLFMDQVYGLNDIITYLVAVDKKNNVKGVEILVCAEGFCDIAEEKWKAKFYGRTAGKWEPAEGIVISGATLSCVHVSEGSKKMLGINALYVSKGKVG